jgi:hypothetical protein
MGQPDKYTFPTVENRVATLQNLIKDLPQERQERVLNFNHLMEKLHHPSPYLPTSGLEAETFAVQAPAKVLPYAEIAEVEGMGIVRDTNDSFPSKNKENKWEASLEPVEGSYLLLVRELDELRRHGALNLNEKVFYKGKPIRTIKYFVPIHVTFGKIRRDFPPRMLREDVIRFSDQKYPISRLRTKLSDWREHDMIVNKQEGWRRRYKQSDCFAFARMLDATLYATSPERVMEPYVDFDEDKSLTSHACKGFSGVTERSPDGEGRGMHAIELRTSELWGIEAVGGLQRHLNSGEAIGAMLIAYQKMPMEMRDDVIELEQAGKDEEALTLVANYEGYELPKDRELAIKWWETRKDFAKLFEEYGIPDPSTEYWDTEFKRFAEVLTTEEKKRLAGNPDNFVSKARQIVINARAYVHDLIKE